MHFFDGFRTSHEVSKIEELTDDDLRALLSEDQVAAHRRRALTPDRPVLRGTAQNPDTFFQAREAANLFYRACPDIVEQLMARFAALTGRRYGLFEYAGHPEAERVVVIMGSGADTVHETVDYLAARGDKVGVLKVHLFRPFSIAAFLRELPRSVRAIAVMDRTKEPGALGEPLYQDVVTALAEARAEGTSSFAAEPVVVGGRYGLSSKEFTPAMVKAIFDTLAQARPKNHFTVGIMDDVTHTSLAYDDTFDTEPADVTTALFYGLGADGTVGANKNSIKIIGEETDLHVQGYFVYDSKKAGATTVSHLRTSPRPIRSAYLISKARFVACHQFEFLERVDVLEHAVEGAVFLLNAPYAADEVWERLPREVQEQLIDKRIRFYTIDASAVARADRHGRPDQHDHADLLLRDLRRPAARGGDRADQARDREDLQQARRGGREAQLRGGRRDARPLARGAGAVGASPRRTAVRRWCPRWRPTSSSGSRPCSWPGRAICCR